MAVAAIGQLCSTASISTNLKICEGLVQSAARAGAEALFLPEASDYIAGTGAESVQLARSAQCAEFANGLRRAARQHAIEISVGVHEPADNEKVKNIQLWIDKQGNILQKYQKLHLFDVNIEHGPSIQESKGTECGTCLPMPLNTSVGSVGMLICFDIRFPEVSLALRRRGAEIITYPSAFAVHTGKAHWQSLLRARAIETQTYVIAAAQSGAHNENRVSYGKSMIIDPWGEILVEMDDSPGPQIATASIDMRRIRNVRQGMPLARRHDVYPELG